MDHWKIKGEKFLKYLEMNKSGNNDPKYMGHNKSSSKWEV